LAPKALLAQVLQDNREAPLPASVPGFPATQHWTRPRVRLSFKERRMMFASATNFYRKSGVA
jgi:hypothetical protein